MRHHHYRRLPGYSEKAVGLGASREGKERWLFAFEMCKINQLCVRNFGKCRLMLLGCQCGTGSGKLPSPTVSPALPLMATTVCKEVHSCDVLWTPSWDLEKDINMRAIYPSSTAFNSNFPGRSTLTKCF